METKENIPDKDKELIEVILKAGALTIRSRFLFQTDHCRMQERRNRVCI
jgi:hypothetical protein